ncbi:MAG: peptide ABC transporter substrate-binding protein [Caldilineaceae bacterium]|nr:peptide ABC transporter substrate-binding protein [Caldilineaceae bacterium]
MAGESWEWVDETTLRVKLPAGAVWSDGSAYTAKDVVDTFAIYRLLNNAAWTDHLADVTAVDDTTVDFILRGPSTVAPRRLLRNTYIHASSVYGEWAQRVNELVAAGKTAEDQEWKDLLSEFNQFRPADMVVLGPYKIDSSTITESQMILNKVPTSFMADRVKFDRLVNFNGETPVVTPLVLAGDVDYATHGFPPATEREYINLGYRIIRAPNYNGPALYLNHKVAPFDQKEVRQALAYAIDRNENGVVSLGDSGRAVQNMAGFSDNLVPNWLTEETIGKLNKYEFDRAKAEEILTGLGWSRDSDGVWMDGSGTRMEFELTAPSEFADWSAAAENLAQQLTDFGFKTAFRGITFTQHDLDVQNGQFQMAIRAWGAGNPHPQYSFDWDLRNPYNQTISGVGDPSRAGMSFPLTQNTDVLGEVELGQMVVAAAAGSDSEAQKAAINDLALAYNELLPQIPLWERYGNNPAPEIRITGWPADDDPVYKNGTYNDPFVIVLVANGVLQPVGQ